EQRHPPESLTRWHFDRLLRDNELLISSDSIDIVRMGLILTLQTDLHGSNHAFLFGHKSFREFLVGRHWAMALQLNIRGRNGRVRQMMELPQGGRLLVHGDKSFEYLMQIINAAEKSEPFSAPPLGWSDCERQQLAHCMQEIFNDERLDFGERAMPS